MIIPKEYTENDLKISRELAYSRLARTFFSESMNSSLKVVLVETLEPSPFYSGWIEHKITVTTHSM